MGFLQNATTVVYMLHTRDHAGQMADIYRLLSEDEQKHARRFVKNTDKTLYILSHGMLRKILGARLSQDPAHLAFRKEKQGKPALEGEKIHFNISHSGEVVLIAVSDTQTGVDVEYMKPDFDYEEILATNFCGRESKAARSALDGRKMFYRLWTRKEALLKADGIGLTDDLTKIDVSDGVREIPEDLYHLKGAWNTMSFTADEHHVGCIATQSRTVSFVRLRPGDL